MTELLPFDIAGFLGAGLLLWLITKRGGTVLNLAHLFSLVWGPCILAAQIFTTPSGALAPETLAVLFGAWWAFLTGVLLIVRRPPATILGAAIGKRRAIVLVLILAGLQATVVVYEFPEISVAELPTRALVLALRENGLRQDQTPDPTDRSNKVPWYLEPFRNAFFAYLPLAVLLRKRNWLSRRVLCVLVLSACALALTRMTRAPFLAVLVTTWASWVLVYRPRASRALAVAAAAAIAFSAVFLTVQSILQSGTERDTGSAVGLVQDYYGGSMQAFGSILDGTFPRDDGYYSTDMFYYVLKKLNMVDSYPPLVRPYALNGSNIYTFLDAYALDGGILGALLGAALTGIAGGWLFNKASRRQSPLLTISYAWFAYNIVMAVANNNFISITPVLTISLAAGVDLFVVRRSRYAALSLPAPRAEPRWTSLQHRP